MWPWISAGVLGLVVAGAVSARVHGTHAPPEPASRLSCRDRSVRRQRRRRARRRTGRPPSAERRRPRAVGSPNRTRAAIAATGDFGDQIAFIDAARAAVSADDDRRALEILRRYQDKYPSGSFRPEATALKIEALDEARPRGGGAGARRAIRRRAPGQPAGDRGWRRSPASRLRRRSGPVHADAEAGRGGDGAGAVEDGRVAELVRVANQRHADAEASGQLDGRCRRLAVTARARGARRGAPRSPA